MTNTEPDFDNSPEALDAMGISYVATGINDKDDLRHGLDALNKLVAHAYERQRGRKVINPAGKVVHNPDGKFCRIQRLRLVIDEQPTIIRGKVQSSFTASDPTFVLENITSMTPTYSDWDNDLYGATVVIHNKLRGAANPGDVIYAVHNTNSWRYELLPKSGGAGGLESVIGGSDISVDNTDPLNPIVSFTGGGAGGEYLYLGKVQSTWTANQECTGAHLTVSIKQCNRAGTVTGDAFNAYIIAKPGMLTSIWPNDILEYELIDGEAWIVGEPYDGGLHDQCVNTRAVSYMRRGWYLMDGVANKSAVGGSGIKMVDKGGSKQYMQRSQLADTACADTEHGSDSHEHTIEDFNGDTEDVEQFIEFNINNIGVRSPAPVSNTLNAYIKSKQGPTYDGEWTQDTHAHIMNHGHTESEEDNIPANKEVHYYERCSGLTAGTA